MGKTEFVESFGICLAGLIRGMHKLMKLLDRYEKAPGQVVNKSKTKLFLGGMTFARKVTISEEIGISVANLLEKYLGIKIVSGRVNKQAVSNMVDSLSRKLTKLQGRLMSFRVRLVLVKSVMERSLIYWMGVYKWPVNIINEC